MMPRYFRSNFSPKHTFALLLAAFSLAFFSASPADAQRGAGAMGHSAAGPHFFSGGHRPASPLAHRSPHIPYQPSARNFGRPISRNFAPFTRRTALTNRSNFVNFGFNRRGRNRFRSAFGFPDYGFFPYGYDYWPWWGWDSYDSNNCNSYDAYGNCRDAQNRGAQDTDTSGYIESSDDTLRPMITVYLRDGTGYGALDYWVTNGMLHIQTTYGVQKTFPMDQVDLERTGKENALHGANFIFGNLPRVSDPGPVLAPDSYAPACPAVSSTAATSHVDSQSPAANDSKFGATGNPTEKGFTIASVRPNSPAAQAGLQAGDVVVRVDCQPVRNSKELETAFSSGSANGPVWVSYLIQGSWLTDKKLIR